jgi:hypothetical protein
MTPSVGADTPEHVVGQLFDAAGIKRIVCVDDAYAATVDTLLVTLAGFTPEERASVFDAADGEFKEDGVWQQRVRDKWEELEDEERASRVDKAYAIAGNTEPVRKGAIHALRALLTQDGDVELLGLSLSRWRKQQGSLIGELEDKPALILFDQDFSHEGGSATEGERLIEELEKALKQQGASDGAYYGLLTNTVDVDNESERRQEIVEESHVDAARLVVISKRNLADDELGRFAFRLRTTLLAPIFADLLQEVTSTVAHRQVDAIKRAQKIAPEDMERMVVRSSDREGEWAPETLVRILEAMARTDIRKQLRVADRVGDLTQRLRRIAAIASPTQPEKQDTATVTASQAALTIVPVPCVAAVDILRKEIYDEAVQVNELHLPIELGDLIEHRTNKTLWAVVTQPCALMVRGKGERAPELTHMILAKVEEQKDPQELFAEFKLPYYFDDGNKDGIVRLSRPAFVRSIILDSCVFNTDGVARLDLDAATPGRLLPHWQLRHVLLKRVGEKLLERTGAAGDEIGPAAIAGHYPRDIFPPVKVDGAARCIEWDCRRVGRIGDPYARALLTRFSQYMARDAYLNDLARQ